MSHADPTPPAKPFRVIIVGGGIVGLTLSHALQLGDIDHVVLEKHKEIISVRGAALVLWPGVLRVFDQFGFLKKILDSTTPLSAEYRRWPDGSVNSMGNMVQEFGRLFEVPMVLFDRQSCVTHLYENLPDKSKIHTGKKLERIEHTDTGVRVYLADGSVEEGDMVVGADGVHSMTRKLMWDYAEATSPGSIPATDKNIMISEFSAIFGVSTQEERFGLGPADSHVIFGHGDTKLLFTQPGKAYWALGYKSASGDAKGKASEEEVEAVAKKYADMPFTETVKLRDLWETRTRSGVLTIEEGVLTTWHAGRIVLVGDSAHKMTADLGMGANIAIESAIHLANLLHRQLSPNKQQHPPASTLHTLFAQYQKERYKRASIFADLSGKTTRMHAYQSLLGRIYAGYLEPLLAPYQLRSFAESFGAAPKLDFVPLSVVDEGAEGWAMGRRMMSVEEERKKKKKRMEEGGGKGGWSGLNYPNIQTDIVIRRRRNRINRSIDSQRLAATRGSHPWRDVIVLHHGPDFSQLHVGNCFWVQDLVC
ncbi:FAD/NAD(P)-binding domain-containing protein [Decorospora gaudefroyi]|uniref:FAD/NAD(P)-binding domain-containing protein n=1 Tax=Decorospora gaudefroyi TaxID=184978 RepID=A0A6A5KRG4_9PLEO|nr:FAD/NAD(P)-binding domain-containing protein [Decorospora gaudefroyi]